MCWERKGEEGKAGGSDAENDCYSPHEHAHFQTNDSHNSKSTSTQAECVPLKSHTIQAAARCVTATVSLAHFDTTASHARARTTCNWANTRGWVWVKRQ